MSWKLKAESTNELTNDKCIIYLKTFSVYNF